MTDSVVDLVVMPEDGEKDKIMGSYRALYPGPGKWDKELTEFK